MTLIPSSINATTTRASITERPIKTELFTRTFASDAQKIADLAGLSLDTALPSCPGWTLTSLVAHLGTAYLMVAKNISQGRGRDVVNSLEDLDLEPEIHRWFASDCPSGNRPEGLPDWFARTASNLVSIFQTSEPDQPCWTWFSPQQNVGFWMRRMANETSIHRWDAQTGFGNSEAIDADLAADGVEEMLTVYAPMHCKPLSTLDGRGEAFRFERSDGPGSWTVRFQDHEMHVGASHGEPDVTISGTSSNLVLFLWHRIPAEALSVSGDASLVHRYFELLPPD